MPEGTLYQPEAGAFDSLTGRRGKQKDAGDSEPTRIRRPGEGAVQAQSPFGEPLPPGPTPTPNAEGAPAPGEGTVKVKNPLAQFKAWAPWSGTQEEYDAIGAPQGAAPAASKLITLAKKFLGTPYVWGGTQPTGFDCSGFTQYVYRQMGIELPRVSYQQGNSGPRISVDKAKPGDLVFWDNSTRNPGADHVEIYIGRDAQGRHQVIGAPAPGKTVRIRTLSSKEIASMWAVQMNVAGRGSASAPVPASTYKAKTNTMSTSGSVDAYLAALRRVESSNNYRARSSISTASGAYQYIDSTWANYGGYAHAWQAPAAVQDARAKADALARFRAYGNWEQVAAAHLYPAWAGNRAKWNQAPGRGNPTVAQYVAKVMGYMK
jgi:cell wall-associated NlpC family hydrolase